MVFNFNEIYKKYDEVKSSNDYNEYENEINVSNQILHSYPFDEQTASELLGYLIDKYKKELNAYAILQGNGMTITTNPPKKTPQQIWHHLNYTRGLIPLFALERTGKSCILKNIIEQMGGIYNV